MQNTEKNYNDGLRDAGFGMWESHMLSALMARKECTSNEISMISGLDPYKISLTAKKLVDLGLTNVWVQQNTGKGNHKKVYGLAVQQDEVKDYLVSMVAAEIGGM